MGLRLIFREMGYDGLGRWIFIWDFSNIVDLTVLRLAFFMGYE